MKCIVLALDILQCVSIQNKFHFDPSIIGEKWKKNRTDFRSNQIRN